MPHCTTMISRAYLCLLLDIFKHYRALVQSYLNYPAAVERILHTSLHNLFPNFHTLILGHLIKCTLHKRFDKMLFLFLHKMLRLCITLTVFYISA